MRFQRTAALLGVALLWLALGPWVLAVVLVALVVPWTRTRLWRWLRPTWRVAAAWVGAGAALTALVLVVPDGWLPIPPGPGALVTPGYVGRPAAVRPVRTELPPHPWLAPDAASDTHPWRGPLGESPRVDSAWFGLEECGTLAPDSHGRLVALCRDGHGPVLHVIDAGTLRPVATKELPARSDGRAWDDPCGGGFYLDRHDRAVVATTDRHVLVVTTDDAEGDPDLTTRASWDLTGAVPRDDCLVSVLPDWQGTTWFATRQGRVGTISPAGRVRVRALGEEIAEPLAADASDGVYVVTTHALYRLQADGHRTPTLTWRAPYDRGSGRRSGQLSRGSGSGPAVLPGGLVAITDNADPRLHVEVHDARTGRLVCRQAVFGDEGATESTLAVVGSGVVVEDNGGYDGPLSTLLGRTTDGGLARVDVADGTCSLAWTSAEVAPSAAPAVSLANGLVYAWTKRPSRWGAAAWYLTAIDVRSGRTVFSVRAGLGTLHDAPHATVALTRQGAAYVGTLGGLVRVRDRD